jgi:hypothetical protein
MKKCLFVFFVLFFAACGNGNKEVDVDSSNVITDSSALMNKDTTSVIGANHIGEGQMRTDTPMEGANVGK